MLGLTNAPPKGGIKRLSTLFPNRLILGIDGKGNAFYTSLTPINLTVNDIRSKIEGALKNRDYVRKANHNLIQSNLDRQMKISIRKMMSCYWDNSSPFSLDLISAVVRQVSLLPG